MIFFRFDTVKKWLGYFFVLLSFSMITLHSIIPHHHHNEISFEQHLAEHEAAESLVDILALLFHFEGGDEIFESLMKVNSHIFTFLVAVAVCTCLIHAIKWFLQDDNSSWNTFYLVPTQPLFILNGTGLRAPPTL